MIWYKNNNKKNSIAFVCYCRLEESLREVKVSHTATKQQSLGSGPGAVLSDPVRVAGTGPSIFLGSQTCAAVFEL